MTYFVQYPRNKNQQDFTIQYDCTQHEILWLIWLNLSFVRTFTMFVASLKSGFGRQGPSMACSFSSATNLALEVKKLGIIGAGQMVSGLLFGQRICYLGSCRAEN
jgi:hypothetical protein